MKILHVIAIRTSTTIHICVLAFEHFPRQHAALFRFRSHPQSGILQTEVFSYICASQVLLTSVRTRHPRGTRLPLVTCSLVQLSILKPPTNEVHIQVGDTFTFYPNRAHPTISLSPAGVYPEHSQHFLASARLRKSSTSKAVQRAAGAKYGRSSRWAKVVTEL